MTTAPNIRTGAMRQRAELQKKNTAEDGAGGQAVTWELLRLLWCQIRPISGVQKLEAMRRESTVSHEIFARYNRDITVGRRIVWEGRPFNIEAVFVPMEIREFMHIMASEGVAT